MNELASVQNEKTRPVCARTPGHYLLSSPSDPDPTLVYYYYNAENNAYGWGFNRADGGGWIREGDLTAETDIRPVTIMEGPADFFKTIIASLKRIERDLCGPSPGEKRRTD